MDLKHLAIDQARLLVSEGDKASLRAHVLRTPRGKECTVLLFKTEQSGDQSFVKFYELKLANEPKTRIFRSLDAAANAILDGIGLKFFGVSTMTIDQAKKRVLSDLGAEERR